MRIAIIACDHFKRELETLTDGDADFVMHEYLEYAYHNEPLKLRDVLVEKVNNLEGTMDAVLLGYGVCGALNDIVDELRVPTVTFKADDCIAVYLTQEVYERERKKVPLTYYSTPYFSDMDMEWQENDWEKKMGFEMETDDFRRMFSKMFDGYSRSVYIHTIGERECFEKKAKQFADELSLSYETREGTLSVMQDAIKQVKELAARKLSEQGMEEEVEPHMIVKGA
jgi:hypothetical protein